MLDTNVAIHLRDADPDIVNRVAALEGAILLSIVTVVEMEGGILRDPSSASHRRRVLDEMSNTFGTLAFGSAEATAYSKIVSTSGYARSRIFDRMIAAQALVLDATLITINGADFQDIPDLKLEIWPSPAS
nr:PIN domain-containing protein [Sphingobium boeckii]